MGFRFVILNLSEKTWSSLTSSGCLWFCGGTLGMWNNWLGVLTAQLVFASLSSLSGMCLCSAYMKLCCAGKGDRYYLQPCLWMRGLVGVLAPTRLSLHVLCSLRVIWEPPLFCHTSKHVTLACFRIWSPGLPFIKTSLTSHSVLWIQV